MFQIDPGSKVAAICSDPRLGRRLAKLVAPMRDRLDSLGLLLSGADRLRAWSIVAAAMALLIALALYKLEAAALHGRHNIGFLILEAIAAAAALVVVGALRTSGVANSRGKLYLRRLRDAYSGRAPGADAAFDPAANAIPLTLVGAMGFAMLDGDLRAALTRRAGNGSGDGWSSSSCSSGGDGGGGGGCGGCSS